MNSQPTTDGRTIGLADRMHLDAVCDRFEAAWRGGEHPALASYLAGVPGPIRGRVFRELLALELEYRQGEGERAAAEPYREQFPEFASIIDSAFTLDASRVAAATRLADRSVLRVPPPLLSPGLEPDAYLARALSAAGYEVQAELGRGGMGVVFRANQVALNRKVALKVIRSAGFASQAERLRFQNEAEAVAQLDHPGIVPIFDVGESGGLHYFSMKLVSGTSLDRRLAEFEHDLRAAARLVAAVAEAIHHAHQRGILHRDLKPANVLVDEQGTPHVTDFGLARRVEGDGELTQSGAVLGTPSYMAPEQAKGAKAAITTATDVYGLGAILYALLTGKAPHRGTCLAETLDMVREVSPEPPSKLNRRVPRDLEVICLKCLEKEPRQRYPSAQALADDLGRWLSREPITARPIGSFRRLGMWCCRHPLPAGLGALLVLSVAAGLAGVGWKWREAVAQRARYEVIDGFLDHALSESSSEDNRSGHAFTVRAMLDREGDQLGLKFQDQPEVEAALRERFGRWYLALGEHSKAEHHLRAAITLETGLRGAEHPTTLRTVNRWAAALAESGRARGAEAALRRNLEVCRRTLGNEAEIALEAADQLGVLLRKQRRLDEAEPLLVQALASRRRVLRAGHPDTLRSVRNVCLLCMDRARWREAEALAEEYERGIHCARGPKHPDNVSAQANLGLIRLLKGKPDEAEPFYRKATEKARDIFGPEHPTALAAAEEYARVVNLIKTR